MDNDLRHKGMKKNAFLLLIAAVVIIWNVSSYYLVAYEGVNLFAPMQNSILVNDNPAVNIDHVIDPPLGNQTIMPGFTTFVTLMVFNLPIEITIVFLAEMIFGSFLRQERDKMNFLRLLLLLGSALALTAVNSLVHYTMIWPAMHDWPIHAGHTYNVSNILYPQYGVFETFFSMGADIMLFLAAAIIVVGIHFLAFKYIQKLSYTHSIVSLVVPIVYYPAIWGILAKQITSLNFFEKVGNIFMFGLIVSGTFILSILLILLWNLTLFGTQPEGSKQTAEKPMEEN